MTELKVLKLRFEVQDTYQIGYEAIFSKIKRMSVLSSMMETPKKYITVVEIIWHDEPDTPVLTNLEFIDRLSEIANDDKTYLYILTGRHLPFYSKLYAEMIETFDCFFEYPTVFKKKEVYMSLVGSQKNLPGIRLEGRRQRGMSGSLRNRMVSADGIAHGDAGHGQAGR